MKVQEIVSGGTPTSPFPGPASSHLRPQLGPSNLAQQCWGAPWRRGPHEGSGSASGAGRGVPGVSGSWWPAPGPFPLFPPPSTALTPPSGPALVLEETESEARSCLTLRKKEAVPHAPAHGRGGLGGGQTAGDRRRPEEDVGGGGGRAPEGGAGAAGDAQSRNGCTALSMAASSLRRRCPRLKAEWMRVELPMLHCECPPPSFSAKFRLMHWSS